MANSTQRDASVERGRTTTVDSPSPNTSSTNHGNAMDNTLTISSEKTVVNEKHPGNPIATPGNAPSGDGLPHMLPSSQVAKSFKVDPTRGLDEATVKQLMQEHGPNILKPPRKPSPFKLFLRQVLNAMTLVLIAAMAVSFGTQDWIEAGVIGALVILNVVVGFSQEWKAEKVVAALASVGAPTAVVLRSGKEISIDVEDVVPGDIVLLSPGTIVPADGRLIDGQVSSLEVDEALLTGESLPVQKASEPLDEPAMPLGDRINMIYGGSQVSKGRARAVITATAMRTELGKIAEAMERQVQSKESGWRAKWHKVQVALGVRGTSPLQIKLNKLAYLLLSIAILLAIIVLASTAFVDIPPSISTYAVATAVSILPASLIAVVSLTLATASRELAKRNALVRKMDAIEGLAVVTDICSDKTGTLTVGKMVTKKAWIPCGSEGKADTKVGTVYEVENGSDPYYPRGAVRLLPQAEVEATKEPLPEPPAANPENVEDSDDDWSENLVNPADMDDRLRELVLCSGLCNMATIHHDTKADTWQANGDATEVALQVFAHKLGHGKPALTRTRAHHAPDAARQPSLSRQASRVSAAQSILHNKHFELVIEHPFDSSVKRMSTAWSLVGQNGDAGKETLVFLKGAVERVLDRCGFVSMSDEHAPMSEQIKEEIIARMDEFAAEGLRVLCLSGRRVQISANEIKALPRDELEKDMCFLGLVGIYDPPRPQSRGAVLQAQEAGITVRMATGDHPATARAIAKAVAIIDDTAPPNAVITGQAFDAMSEDEIDAMPDLPLVIARCAPETKVRLIEALHRRKIYGMTRFCIMTGDGVNDSPALKRADCGVAMGLNGSDVAKSVSQIVLADDNFASITRAIKKGRGTLMNLSKFLIYLLSGNVAEVVVLLIGLAFRNEEGVSVYPLSPVAALWINTIAAGPPALALGLEPTAPDAMSKSPEAYKTIFTLWWFIDTFYYGFLIGALAIVNFVIVTWGRGSGDLGIGCNEGFNESCQTLFEARGTTFATLTIILMVHSLECKHLDRSLLQMNLLDNKFLLWSAFALSLSVFPVLYIPRISDYAFLLVGISWEWGIVFGMVLVYLVAAEGYKMLRRHLTRDEFKGGQHNEDQDKLPRLETICPE